MPDLVGALELGLGLEEAAGVLEQDLGILGLDGGVLVLVLEVLQVPPQLLVLDVLGVDLLAAAVGLVRLLQARRRAFSSGETNSMRVFLTARAPLSRTWVTGSSIVSTSMAACGAVSYACRWEADGRTGRCSINGWTADATKFPPPRDFLVVSRRGHWQQPIQGPAGAIDSAGCRTKNSR